jgi:Flp pilus assembly protein TadD
MAIVTGFMGFTFRGICKSRTLRTRPIPSVMKPFAVLPLFLLLSPPVLAQSLSASPELGRQAALRGEWAKAVTFYRQAVKQTPDNAEIWNNLGVVLRKSGQGKEALPAYRQAIKLKPDFSEAYNNLAVAAAEQKDFNTAIGAARQAVILDPQNPVAMLNVAFIQEQRQEWNACATTYLTYIDRFGESARVRYRLAVASQQLGRLENATWNLERAIALDSNNREYRLAIGKLAFKMGNTKKALRYLEGLANAKDPDALAILGRLSYETGRYDQAATSLKNVSTLKSDDPKLLNDLAVSQIRTDKVEDARKNLEEAIRLKPDYAEAYVNLGLLLKRQGKADQAIAMYRKAIALNATIPAAYNNLGSLLLDQKQVTEATTLLTKAVSLDPNYWEAHRNLTMAYALAGDYAKAEAQGSQAIAAARDPQQFAQSNNDLSTIQQLTKPRNPATQRRTPERP